MMFEIVFDLIIPLTHAGVIDLKNRLGKFNILKCDNNIVTMLEEMEEVYNKILSRGSTHKDFIVNLFIAFKTCTDSVFRDFIQRIEDDYQKGKDITADNLITAATTKYNNMILLEQYNPVDHKAKEAKFLTLASKITEMKKN